MLTINYDKAYDVLYLGFGDRRNSIGSESDDGVITLKDRTTREITGLTIFDFMEQHTQGSLPVLPLLKDISL